jgi:hypothetical protein
VTTDRRNLQQQRHSTSSPQNAELPDLQRRSTSRPVDRRISRPTPRDHLHGERSSELGREKEKEKRGRRKKKEEGRRELDLQRRRRKKEKRGGKFKKRKEKKEEKRGGTYSKARERKKIKKKKKDAWRNITDEGKKKYIYKR